MSEHDEALAATSMSVVPTMCWKCGRELGGVTVYLDTNLREAQNERDGHPPVYAAMMSGKQTDIMNVPLYSPATVSALRAEIERLTKLKSALGDALDSANRDLATEFKRREAAERSLAEALRVLAETHEFILSAPFASGEDSIAQERALKRLDAYLAKASP